MVTVDYGSLPFIGVREDTSLDLDYEEVLVALTVTLWEAYEFVQRTFKGSSVPNRSHEIHGSEEMFRRALSIELSEGPLSLHEKFAREPRFLHRVCGEA